MTQQVVMTFFEGLRRCRWHSSSDDDFQSMTLREAVIPEGHHIKCVIHVVVIRNGHHAVSSTKWSSGTVIHEVVIRNGHPERSSTKWSSAKRSSRSVIHEVV